jgi:hypothetical protein
MDGWQVATTTSWVPSFFKQGWGLERPRKDALKVKQWVYLHKEPWRFRTKKRFWQITKKILEKIKKSNPA